ncbi:CoB--CoM heterodisulfide reductase iron-sulfur subunit B family protein [Heliophilum fasciatum]|uniref:Heterodisulfide reductase subunit B n=1 Tax=Heliophilum fasciatum TaxID=35700 RepID=A0A4R2RHZ1_9FIRM|nr:CoB--CoM heterodisulfide reductase iron-sulfur subunit B family protein [Heliophilum fasciatum]MCW2278656.1 heterodisulfide reductase subunit B [Heliophilum fasciatum]TCP62623.1 heterodisulfide reductase subunit B [Heliophilum fasciatum]
MRYGYYPGCSLTGTGIEYGLSADAVIRHLNMDMKEIRDWNCCGASSAHNHDPLLSIALPARNLALAEQQGFREVAVPCAACYQRIKAAEVAARDPLKRREMEEVIEEELSGAIVARSLLEIMVHDIDDSALAAQIRRPLQGLKVACYYGCLLVKPRAIAMDEAENPMTMDHLMERLGATPVEWGYKTECCGGSLTLTRPDTGVQMTAEVLKYAKLAGADCVVTPCPLCTSNLDMRQGTAEKKLGRSLGLPIYYFTELMGFAFGLPMKTLGLDRHFVEATGLLQSLPVPASG